MNNIFLSIVIPTYNRADLIEGTIRSLLNQSNSDFEIIVIDDGSTDNTGEVVNKIASSKISFHKIKNSERGFARNFGAKIAKGNYVNFFDSDDIALENHVETAHQMIVKYDNPEIFHLNYCVKNVKTGIEKEKKWSEEIVNDSLWKGNSLSCNGVFIKRDIALKFPFNESRKLSVSEDWELWLRLSSRYKIYLSPIVTSIIIDHDDRSVMQYNEGKLIDRKNELIKGLSEDETFVEIFPKHLKKIEAHMFSYISLHAILSGSKSDGFKYLLFALKLSPMEIFSKRFLAICKHILLIK